MWTSRYLNRIDFRLVTIVLILMAISLIIIDSFAESADNKTPIQVKGQFEWFCIGWLCFIFFAGFEYHKLREWAWILYVISIIALIGLFFTDPIQRVQRWYRLPFLPFNIQPSESTKLSLVIALSWYLERTALDAHSLKTAFGGCLIAFIPFILILKQPDLGTALVLYPMTLVIFYFGNIHPYIIRSMAAIGVLMLVIVGLFFTGIISHEALRPQALKILKEYQYERLNPNTHHQRASNTAIAVGGLFGTGWKESEYTKGGFLPTPYTDSAFSSFGEEFGLVGLVVLLLLFYGLIYCCFKVTASAKDAFGSLLAAGIAVFIAVHVLVNIGMMCGLLPITGVPLVLVSYGGSSIVCTMSALGILQSIYSRRFMF